MTLQEIKRVADDCKKTHRWADVRSDFDATTSQYRIIGIGRKYVRVMSGAGTIFNANPSDIKRAW